MRHRSPKMLVFPSLGSQAEAAQNRPRDSECPWNNTIYPESPKRSILFSKLYVSLPSPIANQVASGRYPVTSKPKPKLEIQGLTGHGTDHWPPPGAHLPRALLRGGWGFCPRPLGRGWRRFTPALRFPATRKPLDTHRPREPQNPCALYFFGL